MKAIIKETATNRATSTEVTKALKEVKTTTTTEGKTKNGLLFKIINNVVILF